MKKQYAVVVAIALGLGFGTYALADIGNMQLSACIKKSGESRLIVSGFTKKQTCEHGEQLIALSTAGSPGPKGDKGDTGAQGPQGIQGVSGVDGTAGVNGLQGIAGLDGTVGIKGDKGDTGAQGIQGIQGEVGPQGAPGLNGHDGVQGIAGAVGPAGADGAPGIQGPQGPAGTGVGGGIEKSRVYQKIAIRNDVIPGSSTEVEVFCDDENDVMLSGGGFWMSSHDMRIRYSYSIPRPFGITSWVAGFTVSSPTVLGSAQVTAICLRVD